MTTKVKRMRTAGAVPPEYTGPVYWRVVEHKLIMTAGDEPIEFMESTERLNRLYVDRYLMPGKTVYTSGTVFDESGALLPEWRTPLKAKWTKPKKVRVEYSPGLYGARISERVYDAIESLEPGKHHAVPIDITCMDGRTERRYEMLFSAASSLQHRELDFEANNLEPVEGSNPPQFIAPLWLYSNAEEHFGYLDSKVINGFHWFNGTYVNQYFSPELFAKIRPMGDIFQPWDMAIPIGVAQPGNKSPVPEDKLATTHPTIKDRLFGLFGGKRPK